MGKQQRYGLETILNAASEAGRLGTSVGQQALINLARCSMCAFRTHCEGAECVLLVKVEDQIPAFPMTKKPPHW